MSRVRRADPRDIERVVALWTLIADHHRALDPLFRLRDGAEDEIRQMLRAMLRDPDAAFFVGDVAPDDVGTGSDGLCIVRMDRAPPIGEETERAEITDLGVRPDARRQGLGRELAEAALAWVRERGVARVEVRVVHGNAEAQAFWRALGFGDLMDVLQLRL